MTFDEKYQIYLEVQHQFYREDAEFYILDELGVDEDDEECKRAVLESFDIEEVIAEFERNMNWTTDADSAWRSAVRKYNPIEVLE